MRTEKVGGGGSNEHKSKLLLSFQRGGEKGFGRCQKAPETAKTVGGVSSHLVIGIPGKNSMGWGDSKAEQKKRCRQGEGGGR